MAPADSSERLTFLIIPRQASEVQARSIYAIIDTEDHEALSCNRRRGVHRQPSDRDALVARRSRAGDRRRVDRLDRQPGRRARPSAPGVCQGDGGRPRAGAEDGGGRGRGLPPGRRRRRSADRPAADPHHRGEHLSHGDPPGRGATAAGARPAGEALSGQHQRGLRQEPQAAVDRGGRPGLRSHQPAPLVVRRVEGDRRVPGPGLRERAGAAGGRGPVLQRGRAAADGGLRHGAAALRRRRAGRRARWWSTTTAGSSGASPTWPT